MEGNKIPLSDEDLKLSGDQIAQKYGVHRSSGYRAKKQGRIMPEYHNKHTNINENLFQDNLIHIVSRAKKATSKLLLTQPIKLETLYRQDMIQEGIINCYLKSGYLTHDEQGQNMSTIWTNCKNGAWSFIRKMSNHNHYSIEAQYDNQPDYADEESSTSTISSIKPFLHMYVKYGIQQVEKMINKSFSQEEKNLFELLSLQYGIYQINHIMVDTISYLNQRYDNIIRSYANSGSVYGRIKHITIRVSDHQSPNIDPHIIYFYPHILGSLEQGIQQLDTLLSN